MNNDLLAEIDKFLAETKMGEYRFGILAANNGRLVERLRKPRANGKPGRVWPETERQIRDFMAVERALRAQGAAA